MASFADLRPIIMIVCVVGFFTLFLAGFGLPGTTPADLVSASIPSQSTRVLPSSILSYINGSYSFINHADGWTSTGTLNNGSTSIKIYNYNASLPKLILNFNLHYLEVDTFDTVGLGPFSFQTNFEVFTWYTNSSETEILSSVFIPNGYTLGQFEVGIDIPTLDTLYARVGLLNFTCFIANSRTSTNVRFAFNNASYTTPSDAWVHDALAISFDSGYQESHSASNAFNYILSILTWGQLGATTNFPSWLYALVDLAFLAPAIYVIGIWILRLLGSIAGGGGSG